jgi:hypothetical protein
MHPVELAPSDHFKPYWMAVPAGTTRIDFRGQGWYGGPWMVRGIAIWSQTTGSQPPGPDCTNRPRTIVQTRAIGGGQLQVTVQAGRPSTAPNNVVRQIQVTRAQNAQVQILGQTIGAGGGTVALPTPGQSQTFTVARQPAGAQVPVTVAFTVTDDCGAWPSVVGGGPSAVCALVPPGIEGTCTLPPLATAALIRQTPSAHGPVAMPNNEAQP